MSGKKHTVAEIKSQWDQDAYRAEQARKAREAAKARAIQLLKEAQESVEKRLKSLAGKIAGMSRDQQSLFDDLYRQQGQMRDEFKDALARDRDKAEKRLEKRIRNVNAAMEDGFREIRTDFGAALSEQEARLTSALKLQGEALNGRISSMETLAADTNHLAAQVIEAASAVMAHIRETYPHELFCPGAADSIAQRLILAMDNLKNGRGASALPQAQDSLLEAQRLHLRLETLQQQWDTARVAAITALDTALEAADAAQEFQITLGTKQNNQSLAQCLSTDHWSTGALSALLQELKQHKNRLAFHDSPPSLAELEASVAVGENALASLGQILKQAHDAALASILRADMQMDFYEKLRESGYTLVDNAWESNDERCANHMVMRGPNGDLIAIVVRPEGGKGPDMANAIEVNFSEAAPSEIRRREKLEMLTQVLSSVYDAPVGFTPMPGAEWTKNAPAECFSLDEVRMGGKNR